jgi:hypothetical protein
VAIGKDGSTLRRLLVHFNVGAIRELSDGQLLERFATDRGESAELAFAALVGRYTTRVAIEKGPSGLRPGLSAEVDILVLELDNVLTVPVSSVVHYGGKDRVAVRLPEGAIDWREVTAGETNSEVIEIRSGLKAGEAVVIDPVARMTEEEKRQKFGSPIPATRPAAPR